MDRLFILKLAYRNLILHKLRTVLTLMGVVIGISAIVFLLSFAYGIERLVTNEVSSGNALLLLDVGVGNSQIVKINDTTIGNIQTIDHVSQVEVYSAVAARSVVGDRTTDLGFFGTTDVFLGWTGINLKEGQYFTPGSKNEIVVNTAYANFLNLKPNEIIGHKVVLDVTIPKELSETAADLQIDNADYTITGYFQDDSSPKAYASYVGLEKKGLLDFTQVKVQVDNVSNVSAARTRIENLGLKTQYVGDTVNQIEQVFSIFKIILAGFGLITLLVSLLSMFNTLTISLMERTKEVALMKIMGTRKIDIRSIFLTESVILGITGGVIGILFGLGCSELINFVLDKLAIKAGGETVAVFYYPWGLVVSIFVVSFVMGIFTGLYPARRAAKINSLEALRYE